MAHRRSMIPVHTATAPIPEFGYLLHVRLVEGRSLMTSDQNGLSDPYCVLKTKLFGKPAKPDSRVVKALGLNEKQKSTCIRETLFPAWNEDFTFSVTNRMDYLVLKAYDWDRFTGDDFLGKLRIPLGHVIDAAAAAAASSSASPVVHEWYDLWDSEHANRVRGQINIKLILEPLPAFLEQICKAKRKGSVQEKAFLNAHRSALMQHISPLEREPVTNGLNLCVGTWNVGNAAPPNDLSSWLSRTFPVTLDMENPTPSALNTPSHSAEDLSKALSAAAVDLSPRSRLLKMKEAQWKRMDRHKDNALVQSRSVASLEETDAERVHMYVIGSQECEYQPRPESIHSKAAESVPVGPNPFPTAGLREDPNPKEKQVLYKSTIADWLATLQHHLGDEYELVQEKSMWEIRIAVFVHKSHRNRVSDIEVSQEATGIGHLLGNKGGVAVSLQYNHTKLCFVSSHLAAHQHKKKRRNEDVAEIIDGLNVGMNNMDILNQFHHVFWMGDLNYRLDFGTQGDDKTPDQRTFDAMVNLVKAGKYEELMQFDQLKDEMKNEHVFPGFTEGKYLFPPTFKVLRQSSLEYNPQRSPAYTDRILWRSLPGMAQDVKQLTLAAGVDMATSDHKPVSTMMRVKTVQEASGHDPRRGPCVIKIHGLRARLRASDHLGLAKAVTECSKTEEDLAKTQKELAALLANMNEKKTEEQIEAEFRRRAEADQAARAALNADVSVNPYVKFSSPVLLKNVSTPSQKGTLTPDWPTPQVLSVKYNAKERLQDSHLFVQVKHAGKYRHATVAQGVLSLGDLALVPSATELMLKSKGHDTDSESKAKHSPPITASQNVSFPFKVDLTARGLPAGVLEGVILIEWKRDPELMEQQQQAAALGDAPSLTKPVFEKGTVQGTEVTYVSEVVLTEEQEAELKSIVKLERRTSFLSDVMPEDLEDSPDESANSADAESKDDLRTRTTSEADQARNLAAGILARAKAKDAARKAQMAAQGILAKAKRKSVMFDGPGKGLAPEVEVVADSRGNRRLSPQNLRESLEDYSPMPHDFDDSTPEASDAE